MKNSVSRLILFFIILFLFPACNKADKADGQPAGAEESLPVKEEVTMNMYINGTSVPVIWEENATVTEILNDASKKDIVVQMSMYGGNEQFGPLGKSYVSDNRSITTDNGDIVLYNDSNIVLFYGSNTWSYTKLGRIDLSPSEVTALLSHGDVELVLSKN